MSYKITQIARSEINFPEKAWLSEKKKIQTAKRIPKSNTKITETELKCMPLAPMCMTFRFPGWQAGYMHFFKEKITTKEDNNAICELRLYFYTRIWRYYVVWGILLVDKLVCIADRKYIRQLLCSH
jgi:hypothetical protein